MNASKQKVLSIFKAKKIDGLKTFEFLEQFTIETFSFNIKLAQLENGFCAISTFVFGERNLPNT